MTVEQDFQPVVTHPGEQGRVPKGRLEVSVVMPCLNEETTIGDCIGQALESLQALGLAGEVVIADNGSTDRSIEIARGLDPRVQVVCQPVKGYGAAYLMGLAAARGGFILMGDSDSSYDFGDMARFLAPLYAGYDLVIGNRFAGRIHPHAMPWLHRYVGNPLLSGVLNALYHSGIHDAHCGMRSITRSALDRLSLRTPGMEFASEMIICASLARLHMTEIPINYYPRGGRSKLRSFRDGWRHLCFMLLYRRFRRTKVALPPAVGGQGDCSEGLRLKT